MVPTCLHCRRSCSSSCSCCHSCCCWLHVWLVRLRLLLQALLFTAAAAGGAPASFQYHIGHKVVQCMQDGTHQRHQPQLPVQCGCSCQEAQAGQDVDGAQHSTWLVHQHAGWLQVWQEQLPGYGAPVDQQDCTQSYAARSCTRNNNRASIAGAGQPLPRDCAAK